MRIFLALCFLFSHLTSAQETVSPEELIKELQNAGALTPFAEYVSKTLAHKIPNLKAQPSLEKIIQQLPHLKKGDLDRFPLLPTPKAMGKIASARPMLGGTEATPSNDSVEFRGQALERLIKTKCKPKYADLPKVHDSLPDELRYGHYPDKTIGKCVYVNSPVVAQILTSLTLDKKSYITVDGGTVDSPAKFFHALFNTGHQITYRNERTFANFLAFTWKGKYVKWPAWIDTGLRFKNDTKLGLPATHSQAAWYIKGPLVNARIMFYLGLKGVSFYARINERPEWTGMGLKFVTTANKETSNNKTLVLNSIRAAQSYFLKIKREASTVAKRYPNDGYGYVGVCNDSNATVEMAVFGNNVSLPWPLLRNKKLDQKPGRTKLDRVMKALPHDADDEVKGLSTFCRVLGMIPHRDPLNSKHYDASMKRQIERMMKVLGPQTVETCLLKEFE